MILRNSLISPEPFGGYLGKTGCLRRSHSTRSTWRREGVESPVLQTENVVIGQVETFFESVNGATEADHGETKDSH